MPADARTDATLEDARARRLRRRGWTPVALAKRRRAAWGGLLLALSVPLWLFGAGAAELWLEAVLYHPALHAWHDWRYRERFEAQHAELLACLDATLRAAQPEELTAAAEACWASAEPAAAPRYLLIALEQADGTTSWTGVGKLDCAPLVQRKYAPRDGVQVTEGCFTEGLALEYVRLFEPGASAAAGYALVIPLDALK